MKQSKFNRLNKTNYQAEAKRSSFLKTLSTIRNQPPKIYKTAKMLNYPRSNIRQRLTHINETPTALALLNPKFTYQL